MNSEQLNDHSGYFCIIAINQCERTLFLVFDVSLHVLTNVINRVCFLCVLKKLVSICVRFCVQFHCLVEGLILSVHMSLCFWVCPKLITINFDRLYQMFHKIL